MPQVSRQQRALCSLRRVIRAAALSENMEFFLDLLFYDEDAPSFQVPEPDNDILMDFIQAYWMISKSRYLTTRDPVPCAPDSMDFWLTQLDETRFTQDFRVTRFQFTQIVDLIQDHPIFFNKSNVPQTPAWCQLMVALYRFGCNSNGASIGKLARHFRCAEGTVELFTDRCITALVALEDRVVTWPDEQEREEISVRIEEVSGFRQRIDFVDGTLFPFAEKPELDGIDHYSRKECYGMAGLVVCDDHKRIRYLYTGWATCAHDARLMANCERMLYKNEMFHGDKYLLADSGFAPDNSVVPVFKKPRNSHLTEAQGMFNKELSEIRVWNKHCIGILKGRFFSLKGLCLRLRNKRDGERIVAWIRACVVLHNLLLYVPRVGDSEDDNPNAWIPIAK